MSKKCLKYIKVPKMPKVNEFCHFDIGTYVRTEGALI